MTVSPVSNSVVPSTMATNQSSSNPPGATSTKINSTTRPTPPAIVNPSYTPVNTQKSNTNITNKPASPSPNDTVSISNKANEAYKAANGNKDLNKKVEDNNVKSTKS